MQVTLDVEQSATAIIAGSCKLVIYGVDYGGLEYVSGVLPLVCCSFDEVTISVQSFALFLRQRRCLLIERRNHSSKVRLRLICQYIGRQLNEIIHSFFAVELYGTVGKRCVLLKFAHECKARLLTQAGSCIENIVLRYSIVCDSLKHRRRFYNRVGGLLDTDAGRRLCQHSCAIGSYLLPTLCEFHVADVGQPRITEWSECIDRLDIHHVSSLDLALVEECRHQDKLGVELKHRDPDGFCILVILLD